MFITDCSCIVKNKCHFKCYHEYNSYIVSETADVQFIGRDLEDTSSNRYSKLISICNILIAYIQKVNSSDFKKYKSRKKWFVLMSTKYSF